MLHVTMRQASGFHHLQSLIAFVGTGDLIKAEGNDAFSLEIKGPFSHLLAIEDNLVLKAANWIYKLYSSKAKANLLLTKNLPVSSGIGGGSSDAAATIVALLDLWGIALNDFDKKELIKKSGELGADVPVCLAYHLLNRSYFWIDGSGKEGLLEPLWKEDPLADYSLLLVNPEIAVSTPEIFKHYDRAYDQPITAPNDSDNLMDFLMKTKNSLTKPASELVPEIGNILDILDGSKDCILARMSGSGATCFGIYKSKEARDDMAEKINPNWWVYKL